MKKIFLGLFLTTLFSMGCNSNVGDDSDTANIRTATHQNLEEIKNNLYYIKDTTSNLCYGVLKYRVYSYFAYSITCVPCDSVKKLLK